MYSNMYVFKSDLDCKNFLSYNNEYTRSYISQINESKIDKIDGLSYSLLKEFNKNGNRLGYENIYFKRRRALRDSFMKVWLYDTDRELLADIMWSICDEFTWVLPAHIGNDIFKNTIDLFAAETAQSLAEIISLVGDKLPAEVVKRCIDEIKNRVLIPFITCKEGYGWEKAESNWSSVCGGCIGMTAIYLIEDDEKVKEFTKRLQLAMESYTHSFSDDGACLEGLYYWNYGMMYYTAFLDLYKQRFNEDFPICFEKVKKMADFPNRCLLGDGYTVSFSDSSERDRIYSGLSCKLSKMFNISAAGTEYRTNYNDDVCGRLCKVVRDVSWGDEFKQYKTYRENVILPIAQWAIKHNEKFSVAFKGGNNGEPHNHNDLGSIIIRKNGKIILCDVGAGEYTSDYFSNKRYEIFCNSSLGHSVPIINGQEQCTGKEYYTTDLCVNDKDIIADISKAYNGKVKVIRKINTDENAVTLLDEFYAEDKTEIIERFVTRHEAYIKNGKVEIASDGEKIAVLKTSSPCETEIKKHIHYEHDGSKCEITTIDYIYKFIGKSKFVLYIQ